MKPKDGGAAFPEKMAKALVKATGMKLVRAYQCVRDLTTITAEIGARHIHVELEIYNDGVNGARARCVNHFSPVWYVRPTATLALCAALLAYLKESKNA